VLSQKKVLALFLPFLPVLFYGVPYILHALPSQTVFDSLNGTTNCALSSRTLWFFFMLAKTSNKPISQTTWLVINSQLVTSKDQAGG